MKKTEIVEYELSFEEIIEKFNIKGKCISWDTASIFEKDDGLFKRLFGVNGISIKVKR